MVFRKPESSQTVPSGDAVDPPVDSAGEGKFTTPRVVVWLASYMVAALTPIGIAVLGPLPPPRPFLVEFGVGIGFLAIAILALEFVTSGRFRRIAPVFGADVVLQFHRQMGLVGFVLVLAHPILLVVSEPDYLEFFDPRVNLLRALALSAVVPAVILLVATSLWRERIGLEYEWWRVLHGSMALLVVFIGMVHGIQVGHYLDGPLRQGLWIGILAGAMYLVIHSRVVRPWLMRRRPYVVAAVRPEPGEVTTIELSPDGHDGMAFQAGQYAWITLGDRPHSMQQHPFSFVSSESRRTDRVLRQVGRRLHLVLAAGAGRVEGVPGGPVRWFHARQVRFRRCADRRRHRGHAGNEHPEDAA
jgi:predicted ferric reductase